MPDQRRIKKLEYTPDIASNKLNNINSAADPFEAAAEIYGVTSRPELRELIMSDVILEICGQAANLPGEVRTKKKIKARYLELTGDSEPNFTPVFKKVLPKLTNYTNYGLVAHHAIAVAQDIAMRSYQDVLKAEEDIVSAEKILNESKSAAKKKEASRKLTAASKLRDKAFDRLLLYGKDFGADLAIKNKRNEIEIEKVAVTKQRFTEQTENERTELLIKAEGDLEEISDALTNAIFNDRALTADIEAEFNVVDGEAEA